MGLKDKYAAMVADLDGGRRCRFGQVIDGFTGDDREFLMELVEDVEVSIPRIVALLAGEGVKVSKTTVGGHRKGVCCCGVA